MVGARVMLQIIQDEPLLLASSGCTRYCTNEILLLAVVLCPQSARCNYTSVLLSAVLIMSGIHYWRID